MRKNQIIFSVLFFCIAINSLIAQQKSTIALVKYRGGGDWYANPTSLPNLVKFCNRELKTNLDENVPTVEVGSAEIFNYPLLHITGHGNILFSDVEAQNIRKYLMGGGFLHVDDNYGMDKYFRIAIKKVFPETELIELPFNHKIFHQHFEFPAGLPKVHEHDGKAPQAFGIFYEGRLVCLYTYECDLGDGWENKEVHKDTEDVHQKALRMGANIIQYVFTN